MTENVLKITGGARIGGMHASWPFSKLIATPEQVIVKSVIGTKTFTQDQLSSFSIHHGISGKGIKFDSAKEYASPIVMFWSVSDSPEYIIHQIHELGFTPTGEPTEMAGDSGLFKHFPFPPFWIAVVLIIIWWLLL